MPFEERHFQKILKGIELFNEGFFWECHEDLEHHWLEDRQDPARDVYWAIIQVAATLIHVRDKKLEAATSMILKAYEKVVRLEKNKIETPILTQSLNWKEFKELVKEIKTYWDERGTLHLDDFKRAAAFKFILNSSSPS